MVNRDRSDTKISTWWKVSHFNLFLRNLAADSLPRKSSFTYVMFLVWQSSLLVTLMNTFSVARTMYNKFYITLCPTFNPFSIIYIVFNSFIHLSPINYKNSFWPYAMVIMLKKDETIIICVDYRKLNKITNEDAGPIPCADELITLLSNSLIFSKFACQTVITRHPCQKNQSILMHFQHQWGCMNSNTCLLVWHLCRLDYMQHSSLVVTFSDYSFHKTWST